MSIVDNLRKIKEELPQEVKLVAVSKTHPASLVMEAFTAGHNIFGENKVQEIVAKQEELLQDLEWHFIGHLQRNKVKLLIPFVHLIHSIDSPRLLREVDKQARKAGRTVDCLLQVHIAKEETKFGFSKEELISLVESEEFKSLSSVKIRGLMGMATFTENDTQIRAEFRKLKNLFDWLRKEKFADGEFDQLSMGMSNDWKIAVEEGSTIVRIGSAIFGER
ncbi:MAG: YggS family pyridoxal phosphate-dependent enzyme [Bacteroidia bacterium]